MSYESINNLQKAMAQEVFPHTKSAKKAAGRALGTLVELITYYLLKTWGFRSCLAIEQRIPEYGNNDISHNVEFSLHPILSRFHLDIAPPTLPLSKARLCRALAEAGRLDPGMDYKSNQLLSSNRVLRNSCIIGKCATGHLVALLEELSSERAQIQLVHQHARPYAIVECKRVGVEEGQRKGPQTIEKAKQGAYVARMVSALQRIGSASGVVRGVHELPSGELRTGQYHKMLADVIASDNPDLLCGFVFTLGIVSNHGNWFTSDDHNKELRVLANAYDSLLFLTDAGLAEFVRDFLFCPDANARVVQQAFRVSYQPGRSGNNRFTKVRIDYEADRVLTEYFESNCRHVEEWLNIITEESGISVVREHLDRLHRKAWGEVRG